MNDENISPKSDANGDGAPSLPVLNHHLPPFDDDNESSPPYTAYPRKKAKVKETVIDHTYRDYSQVQVAPDHDKGTNTSSKGGKKGTTNLNFPAKLHAILSNTNYARIIRWQPHGRSWNIVDKYLLTTIVLPHHFSHCKFESFNRSVNGWGFKRLLGDGPDKKTYYHECFLQGRPELTKLMQRLCNPGKRLPDKSGEPNFYEISMKFPLPAFSPAATGTLPSSDLYQEQNGSAPRAMVSPKVPQPGQSVMFSSPPPHHAGNGYPMYGYPQSAPYSQMTMPAAGGPAPPQPSQQMHWPGQVAASHYQPTPYGYSAYPPQMMMSPHQGGGPHMMMMMPPQVGGPHMMMPQQGDPQGYYVYPQTPHFTSSAAASMATSSELAGLSQPVNNTGEPRAVKPWVQNESIAEESAADNEAKWSEGAKASAKEESVANERTDTAKITEELHQITPNDQKESNARESRDTVKYTEEHSRMKSPAQEESDVKECIDAAKKELEEMKSTKQEESDASENMDNSNDIVKECMDTAKIDKGDRGVKPAAQREKNAGEEEKEEKYARDEDEASCEV